ncbi:MAG: HtaA domain-containing protein [Thermoleophilaceae bacterium]|nr:HtaA domain-containing protein [Thermoleophilaceae bacterium]
MPSSKIRARARQVVLAVSTVLIFAFATGAAQASTVLNWTQTKVWSGSQRTWLGYVTDGTPYAGANGTATGTGPTSPVGPTSATGDYTFGYAFSSGTVNPTNLTGTLQFSGTVEFQSAAHMFDITVENPSITFNGDGTAQLYASGKNGDGTTTYSAAAPLFNLDLSSSSCSFNPADQTYTLGNIIPSLATAGSAFPSGAQGYAVGAGPDRTPNTFGSFSLSQFFCAPLTGPKGDSGATGQQGPTGPSGKDGKDASTKSFVVKKSVFKTRRTVIAKVTRNKKFVGYASVKGRKIKLTYITDSIRGTYKFSPVASKFKPVLVKLG